MDIFENFHLETERLLLRNYAAHDANDLHKIASDDNVLRYLPDKKMTREDARNTIEWLQKCYRENTPDNIVKFTVAAVHKNHNTLIGSVGLGPLDFDPSKIEIFFAFAPDYWGKGYATEAAKAILHYGFETIGLHEIVAVTMPGNRASKRVIEKLGMIYRKKTTNLPPEFSSYQGDLYYSLNINEYRFII